MASEVLLVVCILRVESLEHWWLRLLAWERGLWLWPHPWQRWRGALLDFTNH